LLFYSSFQLFSHEQATQVSLVLFLRTINRFLTTRLTLEDEDTAFGAEGDHHIAAGLTKVETEDADCLVEILGLVVHCYVGIVREE